MSCTECSARLTKWGMSPFSCHSPPCLVTLSSYGVLSTDGPGSFLSFLWSLLVSFLSQGVVPSFLCLLTQ